MKCVLGLVSFCQKRYVLWLTSALSKKI